MGRGLSRDSDVRFVIHKRVTDGDCFLDLVFTLKAQSMTDIRTILVRIYSRFLCRYNFYRRDWSGRCMWCRVNHDLWNGKKRPSLGRVTIPLGPAEKE